MLTKIRDHVRIFVPYTMRKNVWKKVFAAAAVSVCILIGTDVYAKKEDSQGELSVPSSEEIWEKFEVEVHYGQWSVDMIKGAFEDELNDRMGKEIRDEFSSQIREFHPYLVKTSHEETLAFDSGGWNTGMEVRFYPGGREGAFSLGFSLEKTRMRLTVQGPVKQVYADGSYAEVESEGYVILNPFSTNLSFRWDMRPSWRITPYIVFGFGLAAMNGEVGYSYAGTYNWGGPQEAVNDSQVKNLKEAEEDMEFNIPNVFFLFQANLGLRAQIIPHLHVRIETGIWDGFILRAGLAFRF